MEKRGIGSIIVLVIGVYLLINSGENVIGSFNDSSNISLSINSFLGFVLILISLLILGNGNLEGKVKERTMEYLGRRIKCNTKKEAYERTKRVSRPGTEPILHVREGRPHYHPNVNRETRKNQKM